MFSDASKNQNFGFGYICRSSWMYGIWPAGFIKDCDPSIEYLELFGVLAGVLEWIHRFRNKHIILFCDNQSVVAMINSMTSCPKCMVLLRKLILKGMVENVRIFAKYITSKRNFYCDWLSRNQISKFKSFGGDKFEEKLMEIPKEIWPITKLWTN